MTKEMAREILHNAGLRSTSPRVAVLTALALAQTPVSHTELVDLIDENDCDPATVYRNLVKFREVGIAPVVTTADGIDRYAMASSHDSTFPHAHFVCADCGRVECLPAELTASLHVEGTWAASIRNATVQLQGECPDCLGRSHT